MKRLLPCLVSVLLWMYAGTIQAQESPSRFEIHSDAVGSAYEIEVWTSTGTFSPGTKYPIIYCMDWFVLSDYLKSLPGLMELGRLAEPYILVGITQGGNRDDWAIMRTRDYTPAYPADPYSKKNIYPKALELTGGAADFTLFLEKELIPRIESEYPADPSRRCFVGYSLGSLLGVYILVHDSPLFHYYLLGSPSLWYNEYSLVSELEGLDSDDLRSIEKIYLSVGEEEDWQMLKGFGMLRSALREKGFRDSKLKAEIVKESGHVGAMPISLYNGIRFLFPGH